MGILKEVPPTAGLPFSPKEIFSVLSGNDNPSLDDGLREYLSTPYARVTYSGTAALYTILEALKTISSKKCVIIPSFICPLVPLAITRAGLKVQVCDVKKEDFNLDTEELGRIFAENRDILAVIPTHIAGIPVSVESITQACRENDIFIIEDCAQALGARRAGKKIGTAGDLSFYSLCRGKGLTIYEGGVISCQARFAQLIEQTHRRLAAEDRTSETLKLIELFGYWIFYRPLLFWFVFRFPQIFWEMLGKQEKANIEYFTTDFPLHRVSKARKRPGLAQLKRLEKEITGQREKAQYYIDGLKGMNGIKILTEALGDYSNYPYLTLIFEKEEKRNKALRIFRKSGLGISRIYLWPITDYKYLQNIYSPGSCPNAGYIAHRHITLSTSVYLKKKDQDYIIKNLREI